MQLEPLFGKPDFFLSRQQFIASFSPLVSQDLPFFRQEFSDTVSPACLPASGEGASYAGNVSTVTGWGTVGSGLSQPDLLLEANLNVLDNKDCAAAYISAGIAITGNMLCASADGSDSCQGDSGGESEAAGQLPYTLIMGVASWELQRG